MTRTGKVFEELYDALLEHSDVPVVDKLAALTLVHGVLMGQHGIRLAAPPAERNV